MATPFVQGRLRNERLSVVLTTECGHCGQSMVMRIDSELHSTVQEGPKNPLVFVPFVDIGALKTPSIIDDF
jgi:hypothetical protein